MNELRFCVLGAPRTKKNSARLVKRGSRTIPLPSEAWERWCREAVFALPDGRNVLHPPRWEGPASCSARFFLDARVTHVDAVGLYQGLADLLQDRGCVADDAQLVDWDGTRWGWDYASPRVEVVLRHAEMPVRPSQVR